MAELGPKFLNETIAGNPLGIQEIALSERNGDNALIKIRRVFIVVRWTEPRSRGLS